MKDENIKQSVVNRLLLDICNELKSNTNLKKNYIEYVSVLLYIKYVGDLKEYANISFEGIYDKVIRQDTQMDIYIDKEVEKLRKELNNNMLFSNIEFKNIIGYREIGKDEVIQQLVKRISDLYKYIGSNDKYMLAKAYEYILNECFIKDDIVKEQNELYTPSYITDMISKMIINDDKKNVLDPYCGSGSFLLSASKNNDLEVFGREENINLYNICMTNLLLHDLANNKIKFEEGSYIFDKEYDVILTNPPFSRKNWKKEMSKEDRDYILNKGLELTAVADYAYVLRMFKKLNEKGKMAVILPHGVLFRENEKKVRKNLIDNGYIDAIIGLPENLFYTNRISVIILILSKNENKNVLFIDASKEYKNERKNNVITDEIQKQIIDIYLSRNEVEKRSYLATKEEIEKNNFNLTIKRYVKGNSLQETKLNKNEILKELVELKSERDIIEKDINYVIETLDN